MNREDPFAAKELKYKQLLLSYRHLMKIVFSLADMHVYLDNVEPILQIISKNIELEDELGL